MSKTISVSWSNGVTEREGEIMVATIDQVLKWLYFRRLAAFFDPPLRVHNFGNWVIPALMQRRPYWGSQWYVDSSYDVELQRVIAPVYLELVRREPWQEHEPHYDMALVDDDLTDFPRPLARLHPSHYSLGTSFPGIAAVMSVYRLRDIADPDLRDMALARLVRHHLGHVLGVPAFERKERVVRRGLEFHCSNRCVMRHPETLDELVAYTRQEYEEGWAFCPLCTSDLHSVVVKHSRSWN